MKSASKLQGFALACQCLLLLSTLSYPVARLQSASRQEWDGISASSCSGSKGSVPLADEDVSSGFGITLAQCKSRCLKDTECKMFSFGQWQKGLSRKFGGHHGEMRCQLYARCEITPRQKMTVFVKHGLSDARRIGRADLQSFIQMVANVLALLNGNFASLSVVVTAFQFLFLAHGLPGISAYPPFALAVLHTVNLLVLLAFIWGKYRLETLQNGNGEISMECSKRVAPSLSTAEVFHLPAEVCTETTSPSLSIPIWRQRECRAPAWLLLAMVSCTLTELFGLSSLASVPTCGGGVAPRSLMNWTLKFFVESATPLCISQALVSCTISVTVMWCCSVLLIVLLTNQRNTATLLTGCLGVVSLSLQLWLASVNNFQGAALLFGIAVHCMGLVFLWACYAASESRAKQISDVESKREARERDLVALLVARAHSRCASVVESSRWLAMVDICMSTIVLSALAFFILKVARDIVNDQAFLPALVTRLIGISLPSVMRYGVVAAALAVLAPLLCHFFLRMRDGMQQLYASSSECHARAMQQLAIDTAEWAAAREREICLKFMATSGEVCLSNYSEHAKQEDDGLKCTLLHGESTASPMKLTKNAFEAWVNSQAKQLLEHRLGDAYHLDQHFISEAEVRTQLLASDLTRASSEATERVFAVSRYASKTFLPRWGWGLCFLVGCVVLCVGVLLTTLQSKSAILPPREPALNGQTTATTSCSDGALKWGGALAVGSAMLFAVPGVGPAGLVAVELAGAAGIGAGGGVTQLISCYLGR